MKIKNQLIFWIIILVALTIVSSLSLGSTVLGLYFVIMLFPVILGTSTLFNHYLVPKFLLKGKKWKFGVYFIYLLIVSVYLELLVIIFSFAILANYQIENLGTMTRDIYLLTLVLFLIVFVDGFLGVMKRLKFKDLQLEQLKEETRRSQITSITIKVNRKNVPLHVSQIAYVESLSDYVKVHTTSEMYITKEKISALEERLPGDFIRIHRSFIVNQSHIKSYTKEGVKILDQSLPIGRKFKKSFLEEVAK